VLRIPILFRVADGSAEAEWEAVRTELVSLYGGLIRTHQLLPVGTTLDIRMQDQERSARARVVWRSLEPTEHGFDMGIEILDPPAFWGFNFPPDRWSEKTRPRLRQR
jgi:hypothetical protein